MFDPDHAGQQRTSLAQALRSLRRACGLTGERLALRANMSQSKISRMSENEKPGLVAAKLHGQHLLHQPHRRFVFLLTESAVRNQIAVPAVMAVQLDHLISLDQARNVDIEVVPLSTHMPKPVLNTFAVYDDRLVTVETHAGTMALRNPQDVQEHLELFAYFRAHALKGDACRTFLHEIADEFRSTVPGRVR